MRLKSLFLLGILMLTAGPARAADELMASVPNAAVVGSGMLSVIFWDVYKATLIAPDGHWNPAKPFALSIAYLRTIDGKDIADRSVQEMRKQGFTDEVRLATWNNQMKNIFPDVKPGSVLMAVYHPGKNTQFFDGDRAVGAIKGDDFAKAFFGIWLDEKTSEPELRRALLGLL